MIIMIMIIMIMMMMMMMMMIIIIVKYAISRQEIKQLGGSFGSIFLVFSIKYP